MNKTLCGTCTAHFWPIGKMPRKPLGMISSGQPFGSYRSYATEYEANIDQFIKGILESIISALTKLRQMRTSTIPKIGTLTCKATGTTLSCA